ncbi:MAG: hypothetical protein EPN17_06100 [Methylobacter sp.]|nr:MAG: hypothetical protein EPN17_06100 [Methylobacter sp.]
MATESEYKARIQAYDTPQLLGLWENIQQRDTSEWAAGKALEHLILRAFELENADVRYPYSVPMSTVSINNSKQDMEQIDGVVYTQGVACIVECKDYADPMNFEPIAKLRSQLMRRPSATIASIFSMAGFTAPALTLLNFIHPQTILAWEKDEITYCLENKSFCSSLVKKYQKAIELGMYNFSAIDEGYLL